MYIYISYNYTCILGPKINTKEIVYIYIYITYIYIYMKTKQLMR